MCNHVRVSQRLNLKLFSPAFENFRRCAVIKSTIDLASTTNAATFDIGNLVFAKRDGLATVPIFLKHFVRGKWFARTQWQMLAFLDEQNITSSFGQQAGGDRAAGAASDDDNLSAEFVGRACHSVCAVRVLLRYGAHGVTRPTSAIKCQRRQAFEVADEIALETDARVFPRGDLFGAFLRRLPVKLFSAIRDT